MKTCCRCKVEKPREQFSKYSTTSDGLKCHCKACQAISNKASYAANREAMVLRSQAYRLANADKVKESTIRWRKENAVEYAAMKKAWRAANKEKVIAQRSANHFANRDRELARNSAWKKDNKPKVQASIAKRTASKLSATPTWADTELIEAFYRRSDAESALTGIQHHVDHIVPLQGKTVCGLHNEFNLQVLPGSVNQSKSNRHWPDMP